MEKTVFKFRVKEISVGWCYIEMVINDKVINFSASYLGREPLETLINACADFSNHYSDGKHYITWQKEPGSLHIALNLSEDQLLHLDIKLCSDESEKNVEQEWHETIPYDSFESAIISEGSRVLKTYGICGYRISWQDDTEFPLASLLLLTKKITPLQQNDSYYSNIDTELEILFHCLS